MKPSASAKRTGFLFVPTAVLAVLALAAGVARAAQPPQGGAGQEQGAGPGSLRKRGMFADQAKALGDRVRAAGKERTVLEGQFVDSRGSRSNARIVQEIRGSFEARGVSASGQTLTFDGQRAVLPFAKEEEALLMSLTEDTTEALMAAEESGVAIRLLGYDFRSSTETVDHPEPRYDLYQAIVESKARADGKKITKLFWFDTGTHLLARTTYVDDGVQVETRFVDWSDVDGSKYARQVERYENNALAFAFRATAVSAGPKPAASPVR